MKPQKPNKKWQ